MAAKWTQEQYSDKPILFWKPDEPYGYFCQWYPCEISEDGIIFNCCEQYMMFHKAKTFNDTRAMANILKSPEPVTQKALGRQIRGFDDKIWDQFKFQVVVRANLLKFRTGVAKRGDAFVYPPELDPQPDVSLRQLLMATGERELLEASRFDRVWGIGFSPADAMRNRGSWGESLLGKALMEVRRILREEDQDGNDQAG